MLLCPVTKQLPLALCTVKCGIVSKRVTPANPHSFTKKIPNFAAAMIIQVFHLFIQKTAMISSISCTFCKLFTFYISGKNVGNFTVIQTSTVPHIFAHVFCRPKCLFCVFQFSGENGKSIPELCHQ